MEENEEFSDQLTDLRCRFLKLRPGFHMYLLEWLGKSRGSSPWRHGLNIGHQVEFTSGHRFGKKSKKRVWLIVAKLINQFDLDKVDKISA